jgi:hypothetical protein
LFHEPDIEISEDARESSSATMNILQAHGITMLPTDESTLVASAMESGQTVVLTGKYIPSLLLE